MENSDCLFCKIASKEIPAEKLIYESANFIVIPDKHPKVNGHVLIIPKKHYTNLVDFPASLGNELIEVIKKIASEKLKEGADGFNILSNAYEAAGQVIMHFHVHLLPRKRNDRFNSPL